MSDRNVIYVTVPPGTAVVVKSQFDGWATRVDVPSIPEPEPVGAVERTAAAWNALGLTDENMEKFGSLHLKGPVER